MSYVYSVDGEHCITLQITAVKCTDALFGKLLLKLEEQVLSDLQSYNYKVAK